MQAEYVGPGRYIPAEYIKPEESVIFDTRPHLLSILKLRYLIWLGIATIIVLVPGIILSIDLSSVKPFIIFTVIWFLISVLPVISLYFRWKHTFYALTDQRLVKGSGVLSRQYSDVVIGRSYGLTDIQTTRIVGVIFEQRFLERLFHFGRIIFRTQPQGDIVWTGIIDPINVRNKIEEIVKQLQTSSHFQQQTQNTIQSAITNAIGQKIVEQQRAAIEQAASVLGLGPVMPQAGLPTTICPKCGAQIQPGIKFCQRCGNRLAV